MVSLSPAPENQDGAKGTEIAFVREVIDPSQAREVFVEMVKQAAKDKPPNNHLACSEDSND
jgi:hypothetical protein